MFKTLHKLAEQIPVRTDFYAYEQVKDPLIVDLDRKGVIESSLGKTYWVPGRVHPFATNTISYCKLGNESVQNIVPRFEDDPKRDKQAFFLELVQSAAGNVDDAGIAAVHKWVKEVQVVGSSPNQNFWKLYDRLDVPKKEHKQVVFQFRGKIVFSTESLGAAKDKFHKWWQCEHKRLYVENVVKKDGGNAVLHGVCGITGEENSIIPRIQPKVRLRSTINMAGAPLWGRNKESMEQVGYTQTEPSLIGLDAGLKICATLELLLGNQLIGYTNDINGEAGHRDHDFLHTSYTSRDGDTNRYYMWFSLGFGQEIEEINLLTQSPKEKNGKDFQETLKRVKHELRQFNSLRKSLQSKLTFGVPSSSPNPFFFVTLLERKGSLAITKFQEAKVADVEANIQRWFADLRIQSLYHHREPVDHFVFWELRNAAFREGEKPHIDLRVFFSAALEGDSLPQDYIDRVANRMVATLKKDDPVNLAGIAAMAFALRRKGYALDEGLRCDNAPPAYHLGFLYGATDRLYSSVIYKQTTQNVHLHPKLLGLVLQSPPDGLVALIKKYTVYSAKLDSAQAQGWWRGVLKNIATNLAGQHLPVFQSPVDIVWFLVGLYASQLDVSTVAAPKYNADPLGRLFALYYRHYLEFCKLTENIDNFLNRHFSNFASNPAEELVTLEKFFNYYDRKVSPRSHYGNKLKRRPSKWQTDIDAAKTEIGLFPNVLDSTKQGSVVLGFLSNL